MFHTAQDFRPMKYLLLNQAFPPDVAASGQYLADLAIGLAEAGHQVAVLASRRAYDDPRRVFPARETWNGIQLHRVATTGFGKTRKWRRAVDFGCYVAACGACLARLGRPDAVVALTSPPLISCLGAQFARWHAARFFYWVMDLNPDEAIAAGWLRESAVPARVFEALSRFSLRRADRVIALDERMRKRIVAKGVAQEQVTVVPPWTQDPARFDPAGRERFRREHGIGDQFVVMYSGNHSPVHPLTTVLGAAEALSHRRDILFLFAGGGSEWGSIRRRAGFGKARSIGNGCLANVFCLPYQPLDRLAAGLSAADAHVVTMGNGMPGLVHTSKIYNLLPVGAPILYVGPASHVTDLLGTEPADRFLAAAHGEVGAVVRWIENRAAAAVANGDRTRFDPEGRFSRRRLLSKLMEALEAK